MLIESQLVEFKQIWKDEYLKTICAFANGDGGVLYIGFDDFENIVGLENIKELVEILPNKINNRLGIIVDIFIENGDNKGFLKKLNLFDKLHPSKPFNPTMVKIFYLCGFIENWGRGTNNIIKRCLEYGLPKPTFEYEWEAVVTTFYKTTQKTTQKTTKERMLELLSSNNKMTREDLSLNIGVTSDTIKHHIANLQKENRLKRVGGRKDGFWEVIEEKGE